jgi:hypothetical protein
MIVAPKLKSKVSVQSAVGVLNIVMLLLPTVVSVVKLLPCYLVDRCQQS